MTYYYYSEKIQGAVNSTIFGGGITSTEAEKKHLNYMLVTVSARQDSRLEGWIEREKLVDVIDQVLSLPADAYRVEIPVDVSLDIGKTFKAAVKSGAVAVTAYVVYCYTIE